MRNGWFWPYNLLYAILRDDDAMQVVYAAGVQDIMKCLSEREHKAITMHYQQGLSMAKIGKDFGVSRERVQQICESALRKMRRPGRRGKIIGVSVDRYVDALARCQAAPAAAPKAPRTVEDLELSTRSYHGLRRAGISTVSDLLGVTEQDLLAMRGLGKKSVNEIESKLEENGLKLVSGFYFEEDLSCQT